MNGFYQRPYNQEELDRLQDEDNAAGLMGMLPPQASPHGLPGAQSLDDIVNQNAKELRRRSMPIGYGQGQGDLDTSMRRVSMMDMQQMIEFGDSSPTGPLTGYQFDPSTSADMDRMRVDGPPGGSQASQSRRQSNADLSINTQFQHQAQYGANGPSASMYPSPMANSSALDVDMNSPYITSGMPSALSLNMDMHMMGNDMQASDMFAPGQYHGSPMMESPVHQNFNAMLGADHDGGMEPNDSYQQLKDESSTPNFLRTTSRTSSGDIATQAKPRQGSGSIQPSIAPPSKATFTSPTRPKPNSGPLETINGMVLPWAPPPGKSGRLSFPNVSFPCSCCA
jgi:hypothetical protein